MPVTVVVGGQKGDEGKGKISAYLVKRDDYDISIRISGPNAGHTMKIGGESLGLATLPCGFVNERTRLLIGRGAYVDVERLLDEIDKAGISSSGRLGVDAFATIITPEHKSGERGDGRLMKNIGSVGTGLGRARVDKINRSENIIFAKDIPELNGFITDTTDEIFKSLEKGGKILLEGDQGTIGAELSGSASATGDITFMSRLYAHKNPATDQYPLDLNFDYASEIELGVNASIGFSLDKLF